LYRAGRGTFVPRSPSKETMTRIAVGVLVLFALVAGCAGLEESEQPGGEPPVAADPPAEPPPVEPVPAETGGTEPATTSNDPGTEPPSEEPPPIVLASAAGEQVAVQESYCLTDPSAGTGICADTADLLPERVSVVRPGERVSVALKNAPAGS
jgi:hypothetical protein